ncbi:D-2-hydroxyacid dehydrogenase [Permianibacter sp. IMCC34836]|uniref:D-2-hydroxyacid dehydrogenase n=1 Tax=Permianibacter fluminis TaxID=2738515 RepID=UPI00155234EE|nr:D-2-hydroxyacid dehydrogenase [Permianibacter fluminis]NQD36252.1 D-2-hydroxyacid dehydrogenase [Permianibacter fluminis]
MPAPVNSTPVNSAAVNATTADFVLVSARAPTGSPAALRHGVLLDSDTLHPADLDLSALQASLPRWQLFTQTSPAQLAERLADADVVVSNKVRLDAAALAAAPHLRLIAVAATGTNNVDLAAAATRGITVCNCQNYGSESVAQHTLNLMLMLATQAHRYSHDVETGVWSNQPQFCLLNRPIVTLAGKTLLLVGHGHIGQRVAELARAFGMRVQIAQLPWRPAEPGRVPFETALASADIVSLHCPQTEETTQLINAERLARMKTGSWLINVARGGLIDEQALLHALQHGPLAAAALDVLSIEPPPASHPLLAAKLDNLLLTPHTAWAAQSARQTLLDQVTENILAFQRGAPTRVIRG